MYDISRAFSNSFQWTVFIPLKIDNLGDEV